MTASHRIIGYVLEKSDGESAAKRAALYRDLSTLVASEEAARDLVRMATDLEAIDRQHQQLALNFRNAL